MIFFIGSDIDVAQNPRFIYNGKEVSSTVHVIIHIDSPLSYNIVSLFCCEHHCSLLHCSHGNG